MLGKGTGRRRRLKPTCTQRVAAATGVTGAGVALPLLFGGTAEAAPMDAWEKLAQCESTGNWKINTGNGYYGGLQFSPSTWKAFGGTDYASHAHLATKEQQIAIAEKVLQAQGPQAWGQCQKHIQGYKAEPNKGASGSSAQAKTPATTEAKPPATTQAKGSDSGASRGGSYTVKSGDTLSGIAEHHELESWQALHEANKDQIKDPRLIHPGQKLVVPGKTGAAQDMEPVAATKPAQAAKKSKAVQPVGGGVSAGYMQHGSWARGYHTGVDFRANVGDPVKAPAGGVVVKAGWNGAYGKQMVVKHNLVIDGKEQVLYTSYSHLNKFTAAPGTVVKAGTQIAEVGNTGRSTGPHLHFEVGTTPDTHSSHTDPYKILRGAFTQA